MAEENFIDLNYINVKPLLKNGLVILDFWAEWCSACTPQNKYYKKLVDKYSPFLKIGKINVSDNRVLSEKFSVRNIPFLILMNNGAEIARFEGINDKRYLEKLIGEQLEKNANPETLDPGSSPNDIEDHAV